MLWIWEQSATKICIDRGQLRIICRREVGRRLQLWGGRNRLMYRKLFTATLGAAPYRLPAPALRQHYSQLQLHRMQLSVDFRSKVGAYEPPKAANSKYCLYMMCISSKQWSYSCIVKSAVCAVCAVCSDTTSVCTVCIVCALSALCGHCVCAVFVQCLRSVCAVCSV